MNGTIISFAFGLLLGAVIVWIIKEMIARRACENTDNEFRATIALLTETASSKALLTATLTSQKEQLTEVKQSLHCAEDQIQSLYARLNEQVASCVSAETKNQLIPQLEQSLRSKDEQLRQMNNDITQLTAQVREAAVLLGEERKSAEAKLSLVNDAQASLRETFKVLSADALKSNNQSFIELTKLQMEQFQLGAKQELELRQKSIDELVKPLRDSLESVDKKVLDLDKARIETYTALNEQVKNLVEVQTGLQGETQNLVKALRTPTVRGRWGEIQLKRVVEISGMLEHCDFYQQVNFETENGRQRPDMVVRLPGNKLVVVDSKAPLEGYLNAIEATDEPARQTFLRDHARQVRNHMLKLSGKSYWTQLEHSPEFTILFLPGETFFSAALEQDPELIEESARNKVIIATPTTLIALLHAVAYGWTSEKLSQNAAEISKNGRELYDRLRTFASYFAAMGKGIEKTVDSYNKAVGSLESRVLITARRFKDLSASDGQEIEIVEPLEITTRTLHSPELITTTAVREIDSIKQITRS